MAAQAAQARLRIAEQLADVDGGVALPPPAALLQDTVDQFEKVIGLERNLLRKSIQKLEQDLEETQTEVSLKEEELLVWEEKLQQIQQANEMKLRLAKSQVDKKKWRNPPEGRHASGVRGVSSLGLITECDEDSDEEEPEGEAVAEKAEEDLLAKQQQRAQQTQQLYRPPSGGTDAMQLRMAASVEDVNNLASSVLGELTALQGHWRRLAALRRPPQVGSPQCSSNLTRVGAPQASFGESPPTGETQAAVALKQRVRAPEGRNLKPGNASVGPPAISRAVGSSAAVPKAGHDGRTASSVSTAVPLQRRALAASTAAGGGGLPSWQSPPPHVLRQPLAASTSPTGQHTQVGWRPGATASGQAKPLGVPPAGGAVMQLSAR